MPLLNAPSRDPAPMLEQALHDWGGQSDLWIFGYASLIWRPDFEFAEQRWQPGGGRAAEPGRFAGRRPGGRTPKPVPGVS